MIGRLTSHARFGLIAPFAALALVVLVHAIYWVIVAGGVERRALAWIAAARRLFLLLFLIFTTPRLSKKFLTIWL